MRGEQGKMGLSRGTPQLTSKTASHPVAAAAAAVVVVVVVLVVLVVVELFIYL